MDSKTFLVKYEHSKRPIENVVARWVMDKKVESFLSSPMVAGVLLADYLKDDQLANHVPSDLLEAFSKFAGTNGDEVAEIKQIIRSHYLDSPEALNGYLNNIQGRIAEIRFKEQFGDLARFPESNNQAGYDVILDSPEGPKYVSVKLYKDAEGVLDEISETQSHLAEGIVRDGQIPVEKVEYAVNRDIYDEVVEKAQARGMDVDIHKVDVSHAEVKEMMDGTVDAVVDPLEFCLSELAGGIALTSAVHLGINIFLWRYREKELNQALRDAAYQSAISAGGLASAFAVRAGIAEGTALFICEEMVLASAFLGPVGLGAGIASAIATRRVLKGFVERRNVVDLIADANRRTSILIDRLEPKLLSPA